jgi:hypothetical protein
VMHWLNGTNVDPRFCVAIEHFSHGKIRAHQLRPDVFPAPGSDLPVHPLKNKGRDYARSH